jgi:site-specific DNA recombinase
VAKIKKKRYVYYHCTRNKGKCPEKWVREEEIARQFGEAMRAIKLDADVLDWVVTALKESHTDEIKYHDEQTAALKQQYEKLHRRLNAMYEDKLDGLIDQKFYDQKNSAWKREQDEIFRKLERHQHANHSYIDEGVKLLELSQRAVMLYDKQTEREKRRIINFLYSNSIWKDGRLQPKYRQPFDMLVERNSVYHKKMAAFHTKNDHIDFWLPSTDSNRGPSG